MVGVELFAAAQPRCAIDATRTQAESRKAAAADRDAEEPRVGHRVVRRDHVPQRGRLEKYNKRYERGGGPRERVLDELPHGRALVERERLRGLVRRARRAPPANARGEIVDARRAETPSTRADQRKRRRGNKPCNRVARRRRPGRLVARRDADVRERDQTTSSIQRHVGDRRDVDADVDEDHGQQPRRVERVAVAPRALDEGDRRRRQHLAQLRETNALNMSDAFASDGAVAVSSTRATTTFVGGRYGGSCAPSTSNTGAMPMFRVRWSW